VVAAELFADVLARRKLSPELLSDATQSRRVALDPTLIARALDNLLDNAERHGRGAVRCRAYVEAAPAGAAASARSAPEQLVFEVCDAGPGFVPAALPRVFEAFYRSGQHSHAESTSLGLGLALVQRIARAHSGRAWAENLPGGGARVAFSVAV
jgi:two-component system OmpR family sensor kinase